MMVSLARATVIIGVSTGVMACSQQPAQYGSSDVQSQVPRRARLCIAEGQPGSASFASTDRAAWAITVSSEGGPCTHTREWSDSAYEVLAAPRHGHITQELQGGKTIVSYWPDRGYVGGDSFALRYPPRNIALTYLVSVVP